MRRLFLIAISVLSYSYLSAQQDPMFTQYMFNTLSVNPAYAGSADMPTVNLIYRKQWVNFDGAPTTQTFTFHSPLKNEALSLGASVINDEHGPVNQTGIYGDFSYRIFFENTKLAFGLKAGVNMFKSDLVNLNPVQEDDPVFAANIGSKPLPNFGFGVLWYSKTHYIGISAPKIMSNELLDGDLPSFQNNKERPHLFFIAGKVWPMNPYVKFKPSIALKMVDGAPPSADITAQFLFYEKLWLGGMYRWEDAVGLLLQYEINNKVKFGYSYDYTLSDLQDYSDGTHELMLGIDFGKNIGADVSPRYF